MGTLFYDRQEFDFDDRTLTHIQVAISTKLRRHEAFFLSWNPPLERGYGRHVIWIDNGVPVRFFYRGTKSVAINRDWIDALLLTSGSAIGMQLVDEPPRKQG